MSHVTEVGRFRITTKPKGKRQVVKTGVVEVFQRNGVENCFGVRAYDLGWGSGGGSSTPERAIHHAAAAFRFEIAEMVRL